MQNTSFSSTKLNYILHKITSQYFLGISQKEILDFSKRLRSFLHYEICDFHCQQEQKLESRILTFIKLDGFLTYVLRLFMKLRRKLKKITNSTQTKSIKRIQRRYFKKFLKLVYGRLEKFDGKAVGYIPPFEAKEESTESEQEESLLQIAGTFFNDYQKHSEENNPFKNGFSSHLF